MSTTPNEPSARPSAKKAAAKKAAPKKVAATKAAPKKGAVKKAAADTGRAKKAASTRSAGTKAAAAKQAKGRTAAGQGATDQTAADTRAEQTSVKPQAQPTAAPKAQAQKAQAQKAQAQKAQAQKAQAQKAQAQKTAAPKAASLAPRRLTVVPDPVLEPVPVIDAMPEAATEPGPAASMAQGATASGRLEEQTDLGEVVELAINLLRTAAEQAGIPTDDAERQIARLLAFARRRLTGEFTVDEYGHDPDWTEHVYLPVMRLLYRKWFRVEVRGIENIPAEGGALIVANHSGTIAFDSFMTGVAVHDETPTHRTLRMLGADLVFHMPFVGMIARRSGSTLAANADAERLLNDGQLVGVWPEGFKGVGKRYSERYKLQRFGRGGFVSAALRTGVPIIPCSIVGAEEIYPMIGEMPAVARLLGLPYAPITPTFPWLGLLGLVPLPSKWLIEFGPPIPTDGQPPEAADDPMLVFDLSDRVRETIQQTLYGLLMQRRSIFI